VEQAQEMNHHLIQCGDHQLAPWSIVCIHLSSGESREWIPLKSSSPEVDYDWVCPDCVPNSEIEKPDITKLQAVCIHCVRELRMQYDPNFEE
jgi:hypothetical protein